MIESSPGVFRLKGVYVMRGYRGRGIGRALSLFALDWAISQGAKRLEAFSVNPSFYEAMGWERHEEIRNGVVRVSTEVG